MRPFLPIIVLTLLGCGQRGPLYLPDQDSGEVMNEPRTSVEPPADETGPAESGAPFSWDDEEEREGERTDEAGPADR